MNENEFELDSVAKVLRILSGMAGSDELVSWLLTMPSRAVVGLHENGISLEVRMSGALYGVFDCGVAMAGFIKDYGLAEFDVNIADVPFTGDPL